VPDRPDLDSVAPGTVWSPAEEIGASLDGAISLLVDRLPAGESPFGYGVPASQRWRVVEHLASFEVGGTTWSNVVVMDLTTFVPDLLAPDVEPAEGEADSTVRMWFAKGVGLIRANGLYRIQGRPVTIEITSTNLR
jgi:hypothetical protein